MSQSPSSQASKNNSYYIDVSFARQSPEQIISYNPTSPPITITPDRKSSSIYNNLFTEINTELKKRKYDVDQSFIISKNPKFIHHPFKQMLHFLRKDYVTTIVESKSILQIQISFMKNLNPLTKLNTHSWKPFTSLKNELINAPDLLSRCHRRLILENLITLKKGDELICLISPNHFYLKDKVLKK